MDSGNESPPSRTTILSSFLRGRPRNASQSHANANADHHNHNHLAIHNNNRELSPSPPQPPSPNGVLGHRRSRVIGSPIVQPNPTNTNIPPSATPAPAGGLGLSQMLRRRRSAGNIAAAAPATLSPPPSMLAPAQSGTSTAANTPIATHHPTPGPGATSSSSNNTSSSSTTHRIRLVPHIEGRRSLRFDAIPRDIREGDTPIRIGRFTDRSGVGLAAINAPGSNKLAFRSKVVSRAHAELWVEPGPRFFIKDTKSSSGTFLNHARLSPANMESRPFQMKDGDILQLGVDYQGGTEDIYKSVKIKIEIGREWQAGPNAFNTNALKNIRALVPSKSAGAPSASANNGSGSAAKQAAANPASAKAALQDCCICLFGVTIRQALFIAPCSHAFHYKCIRPYLESHHPSFSCPLCRTYADLEEDVEVDVEIDVDDLDLEDGEVEGEGEGEGEEAESQGEQGDVEGGNSAEGGDGSVEEGGGGGVPSSAGGGALLAAAAANGANGTVRIRRPPPNPGSGSGSGRPFRDGAETEVEMDFNPPPTRTYSPNGNGTNGGIGGSTLTGRPGGLRIATDPSPSPSAGGRAVLDEDDEEEQEQRDAEEEIQIDMMDLRGGDGDEVMLDATGMGMGRAASEGSNSGVGHATMLGMALATGGIGMEGVEGVVAEVDAAGGVGGKRKR